MAHPGGRPKEHDRIAIANELIEWAKKPDSINLNKFCCTRNPPIPPSYITRWSNECEEFRHAYEVAKAFLGSRREEMLNSEMLHVKAYDLNATVYDQFLKDEKRQQAEYEAKLNNPDSLREKNVVFGSDSAAHRDGQIQAQAIPEKDPLSP